MLPAAIKVPSPRPELTPARVASGLPAFQSGARFTHSKNSIAAAHAWLMGPPPGTGSPAHPGGSPPVGGVGSLTMIGLGITVAATGRKG